MTDRFCCTRRQVLAGAAALGAAAAAPFAAGPAAAAACSPNLVIRGMSLPSWWDGTYRTQRYAESLADLRQLGFNAVAIIPIQFLETVDASDIYGTEQTESINNVAHAVRSAADQGFRVLLKPHLHVKGYSQPPQAIDPADRDAFFENYRALIRRYATLASSSGATTFAVGAELSKLTGAADRDRWLRVIGDARRHFGGPIVYAANWGEDQQVSFWDQVDYIGIDMYAPMAIQEPAVAGDPPVTAEAILRRWREAPAVPDAAGVYGRTAYLDIFKGLHQRHGKPILFTEIGVRSVAGALARPWDYERSYAFADFQVQTAFYEALMQIACADNDGWLAGMYLWGWRVGTEPKGPQWVADFSIEDKPAAAVVRRHFGG